MPYRSLIHAIDYSLMLIIDLLVDYICVFKFNVMHIYQFRHITDSPNIGPTKVSKSNLSDAVVCLRIVRICDMNLEEIVNDLV